MQKHFLFFETSTRVFITRQRHGEHLFHFSIIISHQKPYRIASTHRLLWVKQEIPEAVCYQFVVLDIMRLQHVRMCSNDDLHTKRREVFVYMKLVRKWSQIEFLTIVDEDNYDVHVSLRELNKKITVSAFLWLVMSVSY